MIEFLIAENEEAQGDKVSLRLEEPTPLAVEQALRPSVNVWYGTHYLLRGDEVNLVAICTNGPYLKPDEPGEFLLYADGRLIKEHAVREEVVGAFVTAL